MNKKYMTPDYITKQIIIFLSFLKENNVYTKWKRNIGKSKYFTNIINGICKQDVFVNQLVDCSFYWDGTPERRDYWEAIHKQWMRFVKNNLSSKAKTLKWWNNHR